MTKSERRFMLELSLNVLFLTLGLSLAFFILLSANRIHQETLALSKIQADMMNLSEDIRNKNTPLKTEYTYDAQGIINSEQPQYVLTLTNETVEDVQVYHLRLTKTNDTLISEWDVGVNP